jgi:ATP-dependent RNA helicase DDX1
MHCLLLINIKSYGKDDIIGCFIDLDLMKIKWSKNGNDFGYAYDIPANIRNNAFYPTVCMKNAEILFNFGETDFKYKPGVNK